MDKQYIEKIQERILGLLPEDRCQERALFLADCCSELSRLVACWIDELDESESQIILKGDNICNTNKSHDILAVINKNGKVYLIDPTIWQFFPDEDSILVGKYSTLNEAMSAATNKYGGHWSESEKLNKNLYKEKDEWLKIVKQNIAETL